MHINLSNLQHDTSLIERVVNGWAHQSMGLNRGISNGTRMRQSIEWIYANLELPEPKVVICHNPTQYEPILNSTKHVISVDNRVNQRIDAIKHQCFREHPDIMFEVNSRMVATHDQTLRNNLQFNIFFECATELGRSIGEDARRIYEITKWMPYKMVFKAGWAIILEQPKTISTDDTGRMHGITEWQDGTIEAWWKGLKVPKHVYDGEITPGQFFSEQNIEMRRCMIERMGSTNLAKMLRLVEIDADRETNTVLMRTTEPDSMTSRHLQFVSVICPSTGRNYMLCVPPNIKRAREAVAWTFGETEQSYCPRVET